MQKSRISMRWEYPGYMIYRTFFEDQPIKHTVNQITQRAGKDQCCAYDKTPVIFFSDDGLNIKYAEYHRNKAKKRQCHLTPVTPKFLSPGHSLIFYKINLPLISQHMYSLVVMAHGSVVRFPLVAQWHVCLYPYLQGLVCCNDKQYNKKNSSGFHNSNLLRRKYT